MSSLGHLTETTIKRLLRVRDDLDTPEALEPGSKVVKIFSEDHFPEPVEGLIPLETNTHYVTYNPITVTNPFLIPTSGTVEMSSVNLNNNVIIMSIGAETAFQGTSIRNLSLNNIIFVDPFNTATLLDISSLLPLTVSSIVLFRTIAVSGFESLGTIEGFNTISWVNTAPLIYDSGITFKNIGDFFGTNIKWDSQTSDATTDITIEGTGRSFQMVASRFSTSDNTTAMSIESTSTMIDGRVTDCAFIKGTGSVFFNPTGKDQTDINWSFRDNGTQPDSKTIGSMFFTDNSTVTTINTIDVYEDIAGVATSGVNIERFTFSDTPNKLTVTALGSGSGTVFISVSGTDGSSGKIFKVTLFQDTGSGFTEVSGGGMPIEFDNRVKNIAFMVPVAFTSGDVFKVMIKNTEGTENATVLDFQVDIIK